MGRLFVVGSLNVDSVISVARHPGPGETVLGGNPRTLWGGKGANQAIAASRSASLDTPILFVGRIGDDPAGWEYRARLAAHDVDISNLGTTSGMTTGSAIIAVTPSGENTIIVSSGANASLNEDDLLSLHGLRSDDVVVATLEIPAAVVTRAAGLAAESGARFVFNLSPVSEIDATVIHQANPLIVNDHEAEQVAQLYGAVESLLVTHGAGGSDWHGIHVPARTGLHVVDTTGAGDAYCGALAVALAQGADDESAMNIATDSAAAAVTRVGAQ